MGRTIKLALKVGRELKKVGKYWFMVLHKISRFFYLDCYAFPVKVCILLQLQLQCSSYQKLKVYLNAYRLARFLMLQNFHMSMF